MTAVNKIIYDVSGEEIVDQQGNVTVYAINGTAQRVNKVVYGVRTLIDITDTSATASDVLSGRYFYLADGTKAVGTHSGGATIDTGSEASVSNDTLVLEEAT